MATEMIKIENGFFVTEDGSIEPTHAEVNGWTCQICPDGTVECNCSRDYWDGTHSIRYVIQQNGFAKLTLKVPGSPVKTLRKGFVVPKGVKLLDGTIGLSGGNVDERYAYFREGSFQKFLDDHSITAVKREDPNRVYSVRNIRSGAGTCDSVLLTDGKKVFLGQENGNVLYQVTDATWALHKQIQHERDKHNCFGFLCTLEKDLSKIVGLPNRAKALEIQEALNKVGEKGFLTIDALEAELLEVVPLKTKYQRKRPDAIRAREDSNSWQSLKTDLGSEIRFESREEMEIAAKALWCKDFSDLGALLRALEEKGFNFEPTRYYCTASLSDDYTKVYVNMTASTTRNQGSDAWFDDYWTAELV